MKDIDNKMNLQPIKWMLHENVVSVDYVEIAPNGYKFNGGVKYILHYFTYATPWTDKENIKNFKKFSTLERFYNKLNRGDLEHEYSISCAGMENL